MKPYYQDSAVTIYHGDALKIFPSIKPTIIVTDPPYAVRNDEEWDRKDDVEMARFCMEWATVANRVCSELVSFDSGYSPLRKILEQLWPTVRMLIWDKPSGSQYAGSADRGMWYAFEPIFHAYTKQRRQFVPPKTMVVANMLKSARESVGLSKGGVDMVVRGRKTGLCYRWEEGACLPTPEQIVLLKTVLPLNEDFNAALAEANRQKAETIAAMRIAASENAAEGRDVFSYRTVTNSLHSCQKPLGLMSELIQRLTSPGDIIADPFAGAGTTLLAAKNLGRKAIGIEQEERYCEIAAERMAQEVLPL